MRPPPHPLSSTQILKPDFDRLLHRRAFERLKSRYIALKKVRIFQGWTLEELTRLVRLGQQKIIPRDKLLLRQTDQPSYLYILMRGSVKVTKTPSRIAELLQRKLQIETAVSARLPLPPA